MWLKICYGSETCFGEWKRVRKETGSTASLCGPCVRSGAGDVDPVTPGTRLISGTRGQQPTQQRALLSPPAFRKWGTDAWPKAARHPGLKGNRCGPGNPGTFLRLQAERVPGPQACWGRGRGLPSCSNPPRGERCPRLGSGAELGAPPLGSFPPRLLWVPSHSWGQWTERAGRPTATLPPGGGELN